VALVRGSGSSDGFDVERLAGRGPDAQFQRGFRTGLANSRRYAGSGSGSGFCPYYDRAMLSSGTDSHIAGLGNTNELNAPDQLG
jgi:hypothetical protein